MTEKIDVSFVWIDQQIGKVLHLVGICRVVEAIGILQVNHLHLQHSHNKITCLKI